jgi:5-carboxymethyl-2-hydroxymuconate isomerase
MPQIRLECSANILEKDEMVPLLQKIHTVLVETLPAQLDTCKSRVFECPVFCVGDASHQNAFVHLGIHILPGRSQGAIDATKEALINLLKFHFMRSSKALHLSLSVEIATLSDYVKS